MTSWRATGACNARCAYCNVDAKCEHVDREIYDNLVKNQVWTSVSIDGPEEINDQLRGKGSYKKAITAIEKLSKGGILNGLACALTTINYQHLDHVCELAEKYKANFVWFNHLVPS